MGGFGLMAGLGGLNTVVSLVGALGASKRLKEAQDYRQRLLMQYGSQLDQDQKNLENNNLQSLRRNTGLLGDSLKAQGADMGSALAGAGVSNSSATAGALANQASANAAALQGQASQDFNAEQSLISQNRADLLNRQIGQPAWGQGSGATGDIAQAQKDQAGNWSAFTNSAEGLGGALLQSALNNNRAKTAGGQEQTTSPIGGPPPSGGEQPWTGLIPSYAPPIGAALSGGVGFNGSPGANMLSSRLSGPYMNGMQGMAVPGLPGWPKMGVQSYGGSSLMSGRRLSP